MKMRLIDVDSIPLKEALKREVIYDHDRYIHAKVLEWMLENAPTVDAVPVIRCRECKWYEARIKRCNNSKSTEWKPNDYCSDAERKEE